MRVWQRVANLSGPVVQRLGSAEAAIARVRELHEFDGVKSCLGCSDNAPYPCDTIRALDGVTAMSKCNCGRTDIPLGMTGMTAGGITHGVTSCVSGWGERTEVVAPLEEVPLFEALDDPS